MHSLLIFTPRQSYRQCKTDCFSSSPFSPLISIYNSTIIAESKHEAPKCQCRSVTVPINPITGTLSSKNGAICSAPLRVHIYQHSGTSCQGWNKLWSGWGVDAPHPRFRCNGARLDLCHPLYDGTTVYGAAEIR